jgi:hypothetical protein
MAGFVQIIEFTTDRIDEVDRLMTEYRDQRMAGNSESVPVRRAMVTADRDRPGTYLNIVEFVSHEAAMENSARPDTGEFAASMQKLCSGPPRFFNLDIRDAWEY